MILWMWLSESAVQSFTDRALCRFLAPTCTTSSCAARPPALARGQTTALRCAKNAEGRARECLRSIWLSFSRLQSPATVLQLLGSSTNSWHTGQWLLCCTAKLCYRQALRNFAKVAMKVVAAAVGAAVFHGLASLSPARAAWGVAGDCARRAGVQLPGRPELTEDIYIFKMFENQIPCLLVLQCSGLLRHNHWLHWPLPGRKLHLHGRPRQWHDMRRDEHQRRLLD